MEHSPQGYTQNAPDDLKNLQYSPDQPMAELVSRTNTPYHTDKFLTDTLKFKPTQLENILRINYNNAAKRVLDSQFDGDDSDFISIGDVMLELFPDVATFVQYLKQRTPASKFPIALSFIISRKAAPESKRQELHEFAMEEMRAILQMPTEIPNPEYDAEKAEVCKNNGEHYGVSEFVTDHKILALKAGIFKHLDSQKQKQVIHEQNINIKVLNMNGGKNGSGKNPTLIGFGDTLPHHRLAAPKRRAVGNSSTAQQSSDQTYSQTPKQILDGIINGDESNIIDVTPTKESLMKQDESALKEQLENLRAEEARLNGKPSPVGKVSPDETF